MKSTLNIIKGIHPGFVKERELKPSEQAVKICLAWYIAFFAALI